MNTETGGKIRWVAIRKLAVKLCHREVDINGTTQFADDSYMAVSEIKKDRVSILINLNNIKTEEQVIHAVAHEIAHVLLNQEKDDNKLYARATRLAEIITKKLNAGSSAI